MPADQSPDNLEELLLDEQMGLLDPADRQRLEEALAERPELRAKRERLAGALEPLDALTPPAAPPHLVQSVMARIESADQTYEFDTSRGAASGAGSVVSALVSLREIVAVAAAIMIIVGIFVPSYYGVRDLNQNAPIGAGVGNVAGGLGEYVGGGQRPIVQPGASWLPVDTTSVRELSETRHPYLRLKWTYVRPLPDADALRPGDAKGYDDLEELQSLYRSHMGSPNSAMRFRLHTPSSAPADRTPILRDGQFKPLTDPLLNWDVNTQSNGERAH